MAIIAARRPRPSAEGVTIIVLMIDDDTRLFEVLK
jgi:hypothetical protein